MNQRGGRVFEGIEGTEWRSTVRSLRLYETIPIPDLKCDNATMRWWVVRYGLAREESAPTFSFSRPHTSLSLFQWANPHQNQLTALSLFPDHRKPTDWHTLRPLPPQTDSHPQTDLSNSHPSRTTSPHLPLSSTRTSHKPNQTKETENKKNEEKEQPLTQYPIKPTVQVRRLA